MVWVLWALDWGVFAPLAGRGGWRWLGLTVLVAGGIFAYCVAGQMFSAFDLRELLGGLRGRGAEK